MKRTYLFIVAVLFLAVLSCQDNLVTDDQKNDDQKELVIDEALQATIVEELLQDVDIYSELGESLTKSAEIEGGCPMVTIERPGSEPFWPRKITLDFGEGCEKNGKMKSGIMVIKKSAPWHQPGSKRIVTFKNYVVNGVAIKGNKEIVNITEKGDNPTYEIIAELTLTSVNKKDKKVVVTRKVTKIQEWLAGYRQRDVRNHILITGKSEIVRKVGEGEEVDEKTIKKEYNALMIVQGCRFPQAGVTDFEVNTFDGLELEFSLDYETTGAGGDRCQVNCDCIATLSWGDDDNGGYEVMDLSEKWWKKAREKGKDD